MKKKKKKKEWEKWNETNTIVCDSRVLCEYVQE